MDIELDIAELSHALHTVNMRMIASDAKNLNPANVRKRDWLTRVQSEVVGVCGELAVAKMLDRYGIPPLNAFHRIPDVHRYEVRATEREDGCLIIRDDDPLDRVFILVVGTPPRMRIAGWIRGHDGKRPEWLRNPHNHRPSWFVPQKALKQPTKEGNTQ